MLNGGADEFKNRQTGGESKGKRAIAERNAGRLIGEAALSIRTVASFNAEARLFAEYCAGVDRVVLLDMWGGVINGAVFGLGFGTIMFIFAFMYS